MRIKTIRFGQFDIDTWYDAPFPEEFSNIPEGRLWMCEFCLKYMRSGFQATRHKVSWVWVVVLIWYLSGIMCWVRSGVNILFLFFVVYFYGGGDGYSCRRHFWGEGGTEKYKRRTMTTDLFYSQMKCKMRCPPGDEIYRDGAISVFEVDGRKNKVSPTSPYCPSRALATSFISPPPPSISVFIFAIVVDQLTDLHFSDSE